MAGTSDPFPDLGSVYKSSALKVVQLSQNVADMSLKRPQNGGRKANSHQNRVNANPWISQNSSHSAWGQSHVIQKLGMQSNGTSATANFNSRKTQASSAKISSHNEKALPSWVSNHLIPRPIKSSLHGHERNFSTQPNSSNGAYIQDKIESDYQLDDIDDDQIETSDDGDSHYIIYDSDDDEDLIDDDSYSDASDKSHDTRKKNKWFKNFFKILDDLTVEEINSQERQWHCPACQGGSGAIDWYRGLEPLLTHAKTKRNRRVKLHQEFAQLLQEELGQRGASVLPEGEIYDGWEGLAEKSKDYEIVWPPMVVIMNTRLNQGLNEKWNGMGNAELRNHFTTYAVSKVRHSYGPQGHRGISLLIFDKSAAGYLEAARLHKHFKEQGRDRDAWDHRRVLFCPGGKRQLYGYLAVREDIEDFNRHLGKGCEKYTMESYQEMVESKIKELNEGSQMVCKLKDRVAKEIKHSQALEESLHRVTEKLHKKTDEIHIVRQRIKLLHQEEKEEMDSQEHFFGEQIKKIHQAVYAKEEEFERRLQEERSKVKLLNTNNSSTANGKRVKEIAKMIKLKDKEMENFEVEREKLIRSYEEKKAAASKRYWKEQIEMEKEFEGELTHLMEKYSPHLQEEETTESL